MLINKEPVSGATILINDSPKIETDEQGVYQLADIKEGSYVISAKKDHYEFEKISVKLSAANPRIPDITIKKYESTQPSKRAQSF